MNSFLCIRKGERLLVGSTPFLFPSSNGPGLVTVCTTVVRTLLLRKSDAELLICNSSFPVVQSQRCLNVVIRRRGPSHHCRDPSILLNVTLRLPCETLQPARTAVQAQVCIRLPPNQSSDSNNKWLVHRCWCSIRNGGLMLLNLRASVPAGLTCTR